MADKNDKIKKTIMFSGGGTGGSVTPLLAVAEELWRDNSENPLRLVFVGTSYGPEREMVTAFNQEVAPLEYQVLLSGKWRRYFSVDNILDIFKIIAGFFQSFYILYKKRPSLVISAGAFVSVPLAWAAYLCRVPVLIHQQDVRPGLANKLMAPIARVITVVFEKSLLDYGPRAVFIGNPLKNIDQEACRALWSEIQNKYNLTGDKPVVLVIGGRMGAQALNDLIFSSRSLLSFCQVIHLAGTSKLPTTVSDYPDYHPLESLPHQDTLALMSGADLVIARCGMASLTELAAFNKTALLVPIPDSHQEDNAAVFAASQAAIVLNQKDLTPEILRAEIKRVLEDMELREKLSSNIGRVIKRGAREALAGIIWEIVK